VQLSATVVGEDGEALTTLTTTVGATYAVTVTATTADDRTAVERTEILVKFP